MGLCASKDKKDKVIEGDGAANATANGGEPNGTATTASAGEAAGQEGCVYSTVGGREGRLNGACHRSHSHCLSLYVFVCVSNADVRLPKKLKCYKNIIALVSDRDRELLNQAGPGQASAGHFESVLPALRMCGQGVRAVCCLLCAYSATAGKSIASKSSRTTSQPSLMEEEGRSEQSNHPEARAGDGVNGLL